jgi:hypothetical protein
MNKSIPDAMEQYSALIYRYTSLFIESFVLLYIYSKLEQKKNSHQFIAGNSGRCIYCLCIRKKYTSNYESCATYVKGIQCQTFDLFIYWVNYKARTDITVRYRHEIILC